MTGLEAAYTVDRLGEDRAITLGDVEDSRERGGCPFQDGLLCSVHGIKLLDALARFDRDGDGRLNSQERNEAVEFIKANPDERGRRGPGGPGG